MIEYVGGLDEVGYGAWAGPYISVVAVFDKHTVSKLPKGVRDSKKTSEMFRAASYQKIIEACYDVGIGHAWSWEIDKYGPHAALQKCYARALGELRKLPDKLIVDGTRRVDAFKGVQVVEPKADINHLEVAAASMIAKYFRDTIMESYAKKWPQYGWDKNKGYGSKAHEDAIHKLGLVIDEKNTDNYLHRRHYCRKVLIRGA